ncbi:119R [Invertebrate iridescent virus 6]|uniref:119R n=1 Tax=Invertebrate iridescent virus 6 TaxID=176652 RepID=Q91G12_IIV6|nr:119R [Invertebrate iridescent virus 6]AAK82020.1 119R [Invertebrate iridescent virus 6]QMS79637.1 hypothetical protein IIV6-T1_123 [Invertebrate iridescent virus 6]
MANDSPLASDVAACCIEDVMSCKFLLLLAAFSTQDCIEVAN